MIKITDKTIQSNINKAKNCNGSQKYKFFYIDINLYQRVSVKQGRTTWLFRICIPDSQRKLGYKFTYYSIGEYPQIPLRIAIQKAEDLNCLVRSGVNPLDFRIAEEKKLITVAQIWERWIGASDLKARTLDSLKSIYKTHIQKVSKDVWINLDDKKIMELIINPMIEKKNYGHARTVIRKFHELEKFAFQSKLIDTKVLTQLVLPDRYVKQIKKVRERNLSFDEISKFLITMDSLYEKKILDIRYHHFFRLVLLTGARKEEIATLTWRQYNRLNSTILLDKTKTDEPLLIKLPTQAIRLIEDLANNPNNDYIFYDYHKNTHFSIRTILHQLGKIEIAAQIKTHFQVHDLRRTFCSRLEGLGYRKEWIDKAVNHKREGTSKHYHFDDLLKQRYKMLQKWADYLDNLITKK